MNLLGGQMAAPAAAVDPELEQVLLGLADGSYVLSTPDGSVAESGVGVVGLLGTAAERLVGQPIADVLIAGADEPTRQAFEQLLRAPSGDPAARRTFSARCSGGATRSLQFTVVCVPLALGWEFTSLLSELRSRDAGTWHPEELRLRHGRALEAVEGVVRQGTQPDPSARLAGILIVVRDVDAAPLTHEDVERRMAEQRAAARAAAAEAARHTDEAAGRGPAAPGEGAGAAPGLEDLVERARVLRERVEDAERDAGAAALERDEALARLAETAAERDAAQALAAAADDAEGRARQLAGERDAALARLEAMSEEVAAARRDAEAAHSAAATADAELHALRAQAAAVGGDAQSAQGEAEAARAEAATARAEADAARAEADAARADAQSAHIDAEAVRAELASTRQELTAARGENALARGEASAIRAQLQTHEHELSGTRHELEAARAELAEARAALEARGGDVDRTQADLDRMRSDFDDATADRDRVQTELQRAQAELQHVQAELQTAHAAAETVRAEREQARIRAQQLMDEAEQARAAAEAIRAEFAFEPIENGDGGGQPPAQRTPWSVPARAGEARPGATAAADEAGKPALPAVGPGEAAALIALNGSFKRLDEAFCSLLGCREEDLRAARWPSIIDRENLQAHEEIARALKAGEIQSAEVDTVYMHAQGLLVPIAGTISLHRPPGAEPHFLFRADVSRTAGVPGVL